MVKQSRFKDMIGIGHVALAITIGIFSLTWYIDVKQNFTRLTIPSFNAYVIGLFLLAIGGLIWWNAFFVLPLAKRSRCLTRKGVYGFVRHPTYSAIIFCFYPAIALFMKSKFILLSTLVLYFVFHLLKKKEDKYMIYVFREEYKEYMDLVPPFFPKLYNRKVLRKLKNIIIPHEGTEGYIDLCKKE